ncbi:hypothetical protein Emag_007008 [Eimeria magna]
MRQPISRQQQQRRRQQEQLGHQQQQLRQRQQSAESLSQSSTGAAARESSARDLPPEPSTPQYLLSNGDLALFAPPTRTPSPARRVEYSKPEERTQIRRACEATPPAPAPTSSHLGTQSRRPQHLQKQHKASHLEPAQENQRAARRASGGGLLAILTSHQDSADTGTLFAGLQHQHHQHSRAVNNGQSEPIRSAEAKAADRANRRRPEKQASGGVDLYSEKPQTAPFESLQHLAHCHHSKKEKGRKAFEYRKRRKSLAPRQEEPEDTARHGDAPILRVHNTAFGDNCSKRHPSQQNKSAHGGTLHADFLLDLSPLLLAKMLQMLSAEAAKIFGSTCQKARQLLRSYCCIVSLSARNVSGLLSLPPAALERQLTLFSGVKTIELELSPAKTSRIFLGSPAAAAIAAEPSRTEGVACGRGPSSSMNLWRETRAFTNQDADSRERQNSSPERYRQYYQQGSSRARDSAEAPRCGVAENQSPTIHPNGGRSFRGGDLDLARLQPLLSNASAACGDARDAAVLTKMNSWSTTASATASRLLEHLTYLKSVTARLKLAVSGTPGDLEAATELLLLLQQLVYQNAHSLVSLKIAVDVPASSVRVFFKIIRQVVKDVSPQVFSAFL